MLFSYWAEATTESEWELVESEQTLQEKITTSSELVALYKQLTTPQNQDYIRTQKPCLMKR